MQMHFIADCSISVLAIRECVSANSILGMETAVNW